MKRIQKFILLLIFISSNIFPLMIKAQCDEWKKYLIHNAGFEDGYPQPTFPGSDFVNIEVWKCEMNFYPEEDNQNNLFDNPEYFHFYHSPDWFEFPNFPSFSISPYESNISFSLGIHYNFIFNNHYTKPDSTGGPSSSPNGGFIGKPEFNYHFGFDYNFFFNNRIILQSGLTYFNRIHCRVSNPDSLSVYVPWILNPVIERKINSNSIELPLFIGYNYRSFSIMIGTKITLFTFAKVYEKKLDYSKSSYMLKDKYDLKYYRNIFYPSLKFNYVIINNKEKKIFSLYVAIDMRNTEYYDFQMGAKIQLLNLSKK